jgi:hypothetical protein
MCRAMGRGAAEGSVMRWRDGEEGDDSKKQGPPVGEILLQL